jgi:hypothetical protein
MKETTIMSTTGYLAPHLTSLLDVGQVQLFVQKAEDLGPWYLSHEQRELQRHNKPTGRHWRVERSKRMLLIKALTDAGVTFQQNRSCTMKELQDFARMQGINLSKQKEHVIMG